jgi:hypothetical protein
MAGLHLNLRGPWRHLLKNAFLLLDDAAIKANKPVEWTLGGGTVLMHRHRHRRSKDIGIFLDDPQWLGYLSPRLGGAAESMTAEYQSPPIT